MGTDLGPVLLRTTETIAESHAHFQMADATAADRGGVQLMPVCVCDSPPNLGNKISSVVGMTFLN